MGDMLAERFALSALAGFLITSPPARGAPESAARATRLEIRLDEQLGLKDLELAGGRAAARVDFFCEPGTRPLPGSSLRLFVESSGGLDERSYLSVWLNHGILRSVRLDPRVPRSELLIPIPDGMLRASNHLVLAVEQAAAREELLWTRVLARSSILLTSERAPVAWSLDDLPAPLLHAKTYGARRLTVVVPSDPSPLTLEATALAVANLSRRVAPEAISLAFVHDPARATSPLLMVGTSREQEGLRRLELPPVLRVTPAANGFALARRGELLEDSTGVLALLADPTAPEPMLLISGNTPEAVARASRAIDAPGAKGEVVRFARDSSAARPRGPREWRGFAPPRGRFTLGEVGDEEAEWTVTADTPARVRIRATPDARFLPYGHALKLAFRGLPAMAADPDAALEVYWNDFLIRQESLRSLARGTYFALSLRVPPDRLRRDNVLTVAWNGRSGASGPFVTLQPESELYLPREFGAILPNLALLQSSFYPLSLHADFSDTMVLMPEEGGEDGFATLCELAALLGRLAPGDHLRFKVARGAELQGRRPNSNLILLETVRGAVNPALPLPDMQALPRREALARLPLVEARLSPWGTEMTVLRIRAGSPALLRAAVRSLSRPGLLERLSGDTAFLAAEGPLCFTLGAQRTFREVSYLTRLEAWLRDNWLALPAILAIGSGLLFMALRLTFEERRAARVRRLSAAP
jgi:hypothetical protein